MVLAVLRLGHRPARDKRITTHVALVARAFGADRIYIDTRDQKIEDTIGSLCSRFGGEFIIETGVDAKKLLARWSGCRVHLTMYGDDLQKAIPKIRTMGDLLIIVGAEKVPPVIYEKADFNVAVGNQPHSEVAALAIFLDRYTKGTWQQKQFHGAIEILPSSNRKQVVTKKHRGR